MRQVQQSLETICLEYITVCPTSNPSVNGAEGYYLKQSLEFKILSVGPYVRLNVTSCSLKREGGQCWGGSWGPPAALSRKVSEHHHSVVLPCPASMGSAVGNCWLCLEGAPSFWLGCRR